MPKHLNAAIPWLPFLPVDNGGPEPAALLVGMGRSGTTWAGNIINHDQSHRILFEPFFPAKVRAAHRFEYLQYLNPGCAEPALEASARQILAGKVRSSWIDRENRRWLYRRRLLKDIRCNLMVAWLKRVANDPPVVVVIRHPLQVLASWKKLGWGREAAGQRSDFDIITSQARLTEDFPIISELGRRIDRDDFVETTIFQWCVCHLVPMAQLAAGDAYPLFYENLLLDFEHEAARLMRYLDRPFDAESIRRAASGASSTNFQKRDFAGANSALLDSWKDIFSRRQIRRAHDILTAFGLAEMYDQSGRPSGLPIFTGTRDAGHARWSP